jgi:hypothetical protein
MFGLSNLLKLVTKKNQQDKITIVKAQNTSHFPTSKLNLWNSITNKNHNQLSTVCIVRYNVFEIHGSYL